MDEFIIELFYQKLEENPYLYELEDLVKERRDELLSDEAKPDLHITQVRVSTMTTLCDLGIDINLQKLYDHIPIYENLEYDYKIKSCEYMNNPPRGTPKLKRKKSACSNHKKRKSFYNQATIILYYKKNINLKLFRNGSIHITGILNENHGKQAVEYLCNEIREIYKKEPKITTSSIDKLGLVNWDIVLINSDFVCDFRIRRDKLY